MKEGRPRIFETAEDLEKAIQAFFDSGEKRTITGLALSIGFESRQSIYDYEKDGKFSYIIKKARLMVENAYEEMLFDDKPTGAIFALKNMGWADSQKTEHAFKGLEELAKKLPNFFPDE